MYRLDITFCGELLVSHLFATRTEVVALAWHLGYDREYLVRAVADLADEHPLCLTHPSPLKAGVVLHISRHLVAN